MQISHLLNKLCNFIFFLSFELHLIYTCLFYWVYMLGASRKLLLKYEAIVDNDRQGAS